MKIYRLLSYKEIESILLNKFVDYKAFQEGISFTKNKIFNYNIDISIASNHYEYLLTIDSKSFLDANERLTPIDINKWIDNFDVLNFESGGYKWKNIDKRIMDHITGYYISSIYDYIKLEYKPFLNEYGDLFDPEKPENYYNFLIDDYIDNNSNEIFQTLIKLLKENYGKENEILMFNKKEIVSMDNYRINYPRNCMLDIEKVTVNTKRIVGHMENNDVKINNIPENSPIYKLLISLTKNKN